MTNPTIEYMKIILSISEYFDKYGFPQNFDETDKEKHLTVNFEDRYVIDVRPYKKEISTGC